MIDAILIANRGEIACRVIRTCRRLGIRAIAVYSDADRNALHVALADDAVHIGPAPATESYLSIPALLDAARRTGADAVHPGVGFLAENADFASACADAGLIFIGPSSAAIAAMGNKTAAREMVAAVGVPIAPGYGGADQSNERLATEAERIGWPVMVKAAAGGGGKGMRLVARPEDLAEALASARREARQAFGSDELLLELAVERPRHIEFQVFGDNHGNLVHLGERECSVQRRHQKIIEESPSIALIAALRAAMGEAAIRAARTVGYTNAGTVEFLLAPDGAFYFLEMNTRLQVEHPVTELVTGLDLVEWQIRIAEGEPLPLRQDEVVARGHAVEARLYAENPANDFLPVTGRVALWRPPTPVETRQDVSLQPDLRVDSGIRTGDDITIYYDPMVAKIIAWGPDRATATRLLTRAVEATVILGLTTNREYLRAILTDAAYRAGDLSTAFLDERLAGWRGEDTDARAVALIAATLAQWSAHPQIQTSQGYWRNNPNAAQRYRYTRPDAEHPIEVSLTPRRQVNVCDIVVHSEPPFCAEVELNAWDGADMTLTVDGHRRPVTLAHDGIQWWIHTRDSSVALRALPRLPEPHAPADAGGSLRAPMPGQVLEVLVEVGQHVVKGDALVKLEAMKMEHTIRTMADGVVTAVHFAAGDTVAADALLVQVSEDPGIEQN
ncbi:MAG: biotin carboxylase N-terminal domain-containing protein [Anaerolineae bacterium]